ncbi:hypothetical protein LCGC14_3082080 [marine sediment metagenome]|uniref:Uncharacterized protein n=1 Tax=marine sediment metagenome TaxID=412755 RepID=A0A0F8WDU1_9ZZZZ
MLRPKLTTQAELITFMQKNIDISSPLLGSYPTVTLIDIDYDNNCRAFHNSRQGWYEISNKQIIIEAVANGILTLHGRYMELVGNDAVSYSKFKKLSTHELCIQLALGVIGRAAFRLTDHYRYKCTPERK